MSSSWLGTGLLLFFAFCVVSAPLGWLLRLGKPPRGRAFVGHGDLRVLLSLILWLALGYFLYRASQRRPSPAPTPAPAAPAVPAPPSPVAH